MPPSFAYVEEQLRKRTYGIISTVTPEGRSHSTGIVYGVSPPEQQFSLYLITLASYRKTKNIRNNPNVSFVIPFPHSLLGFIPPSSAQFQGRAEILPFDNHVGIQAFQTKRVLRITLEHARKGHESGERVFIRVVPDEKVHCFGLGVSLWRWAIRRDVASGFYSVAIPQDRR